MATFSSLSPLRFGVVSDLHICLPHTLWDSPHRFHMVEVSIPALEVALTDLATQNLDFLLLPGDLTQHGEPENHAWLVERLQQFPAPVYVIPGNHDIPYANPGPEAIAAAEFPQLYREFGYAQPEQPSSQLYYTCLLQPGVRLIGLNSIQFDSQGEQFGAVDQAQLDWLAGILGSSEEENELVLVMIHHNVIEHFPNQAEHQFGRRYILANAPALLEVLQTYGVQLVFTGHLHVQDIAYSHGVYDITTGSLVSYPHPYRIIELQREGEGLTVEINSAKVAAVGDLSNLQQVSKEWMGERSLRVLAELLRQPPLNLSQQESEALAPQLRYFWADLAAGDSILRFPDLPTPLRQHFEGYSSDHHPHWQKLGLRDNAMTLRLTQPHESPGCIAH